jgi:hypothetical protein
MALDSGLLSLASFAGPLSHIRGCTRMLLTRLILCTLAGPPLFDHFTSPAANLSVSVKGGVSFCSFILQVDDDSYILFAGDQSQPPTTTRQRLTIF